MRFRPLFLIVALSALLAACTKTNAPVRLDLIGNATLASGSRTVNPNDTLTTRAYAVGNDNELAHFRVTVKYEPTRNPILYPVPLSGYKASDTPNDDELVYLDSVITPIESTQYRGGEFLLLNKFTVRSTSGSELWQYTVTDSQGQTASRAYRLTARKPDSAAVFHSYTALLRPVPPRALVAPSPRALFTADSLRDQSRVFLNLRSGLLLPKYALLNNQNTLQANQPLIDLICVTNGSTVTLSAPASADLAMPLSPMRWPAVNRQLTRLVSTGLSAANFDTTRAAASFARAFATGRPFTADSLSTGTLVKSSVIAFRTAAGDYGLLQVADLVTGTAPRLTCSVRMRKRR